MSRLGRLTVLGAGVLGRQIAWHNAFEGKTVILYDIVQDAIERCWAVHDQCAIYLSDAAASAADITATKQRLTFTTDLAAVVAQADLVIERCQRSRTSRPLSTSRWRAPASGHPRRDQLLDTSPQGLRLGHRPPGEVLRTALRHRDLAMNFAELMAHPGTSRATLTQVGEFAVEIGMMPVPVLKEHNGYIVNAWFVPLVSAAQTLVTNGIAPPEDVDRAFMIGGRASHRWACWTWWT